MIGREKCMRQKQTSGPWREMAQRSSVKHPFIHFKSICTLWCVEWLANRNLLYSTGSSIRYYVMVCVGKDWKKNECVYMYNWIALLYSRNHYKLHKSTIFQKNFFKWKKKHLLISYLCQTLEAGIPERLGCSPCSKGSESSGKDKAIKKELGRRAVSTGWMER